jgi:hypothetical protein
VKNDSFGCRLEFELPTSGLKCECNYLQLPRIKFGERHTIETLITEECLLFTKYLRAEKRTWSARLAEI